MKFEIKDSYANILQDAVGFFVGAYALTQLLANNIEKRKYTSPSNLELATEPLPFSIVSSTTIACAWRSVKAQNILSSSAGLFAFSTTFSFPFAGALFLHLDSCRLNQTSELYWLVKSATTTLSALAASSLIFSEHLMSANDKNIALATTAIFPTTLIFLNHRANDYNSRIHDRNILAQTALVTGIAGMALKARGYYATI
jgi:hypothetical protein